MKHPLLTLVLLAGVAGGFAFAAPCLAADEAAPAQGAKQMPVKEGAAVGPQTPIALVNGKAVVRAEYDRALRAYMAQFKQVTGGMHGGVAEPNPQMKAEVLDQVVDRELLYQEGAKTPPEDLAAKVDEQFQGIRSNPQFAEPGSFEAKLAEEGFTEESLKDLLGRQVTIAHYVETQIVPGVKVGDAEVEAFYKENEEKFSSPESVHARHILIRSQEGDKEEDRKGAREKAEAALERAKSGEDFEALAKELSEDPGSAPRGGDLGFFSRERMVKPFADAAFALEKAGQVSEVVESQFGYHVIQLVERREAGKRPLDEVREDLANYLRNQAVGQAVQAKVGELKAAAKIDVVGPHL